jgi:ferric enterobactin receptor
MRIGSFVAAKRLFVAFISLSKKHLILLCLQSNKMKKAFFFTTALLLSISLFAQFPMGGGNAKGGQSVPNMGHVYGKIVDKEMKPIQDVSIIILHGVFDTVTKKRKEVLLKGVSTKANGEFSLEDLPIMGPLKLEISATGYKPVVQTVSFQLKMDAGSSRPAANGGAPDMSAVTKMASAFDKDLGNIKMETDAQQMQGVVVTSTSSKLRMDIDKKVFNVDKNIVSTGGTALDVMKNVPSVQVDIDGNVKLRNSAPQIYVDGRPTTLTLDQIPADAIESVEVITNPSAKYDASGGNAGILNIVLKKNRKTGYNGNLLAGVDKFGGGNAGGSFNVRQGKFNVTANAFSNLMRNRSTGTLTKNFFGYNPPFIDVQNSADKTHGGFVFGSLGFDYFITNRTTFSITGIKVHGEFKPNSIINDITDSSGNGTINETSYQRTTNGDRTFNATGGTFGMKHIFPKAGEEWTTDANFFSGKNTGNSFYTTNYYNNTGFRGTELEKLISTGNNKFLTVQTDFVDPINDKSKIEAGLRAQFRNFENNNSTFLQDTSAAAYKEVTAAASNYKNRDQVLAAYFSYTGAIKNFGYKIGIRGESSNNKGQVLNLDTTYTHNYPNSFFPSVFLSQKLNNKQEIQISYTRRINRPSFFNMIPYTDRTNKLNVTRGNPDLVPEFTNSLEASYSKSFKGNNSLLASVYYKSTTNLITPFLTNEIDSVTGGTILTYVNANSSYSYGSELTSINYINKWWDVTTNVNLYNSKINITNVKDAPQQPAMWSWFGKINNNFKLPKNFTVQLSGYYQSKTNLPVNQNQGGFGPPQQAQSASQGFIRPFYSVDAAIKKTLLKSNAGAVTLSFSDIFRTRKQDQYAEGINFTQDYSRISNPQMIRLTFSYRFGKMDMSLFKRKNLNNNGMSGATEGMGQ